MRLRFMTAFGLIAALLTAGFAAGPVSAANPTCDGYQATYVMKKAGGYIATGTGLIVVVGSSGADSIEGTDNGQQLIVCSGGGNDFIRIYGEGSVVYGGSGNDSIQTYTGASAYGESGNDHFIGPLAFDVDGGSGNDVIGVEVAEEALGGSGNDTFDMVETALLDCGSGVDHYGVFSAGTVKNCEINDAP